MCLNVNANNYFYLSVFFMIPSVSAVGPNATTDDSDDSESRAQYVSANCVVFTHYRGDAATEVEEHFQRALAQDKPKGSLGFIFTCCNR
jgi:hypothetical protein